MTTTSESFQAWLNNRLTRQGWTKAELARRSGVSQPQISRILNGDRGIGEESLIAIARALQVPPEEAFRAAGLLPQKAADDPLAEEARYIVANLSPEKRRMAIGYLRFLAQEED